MASFSQLLSSFEDDPDKRGKQFERFVKWFLTADPEWSTQVSQAWLWNEYPNRWGRDCGIDLVFKHKNGQTWAVQAKCYSPTYEIKKPDVDKFLSESNRKEIDHRLIIATTDRFGANAKQVCDAQEKPVVRYLRIHFENAAVDYPDHISKLSLGKRKAPPDPHSYQLDAIKDVVAGFETAERGQLIMACGTGKTFVSLWVKERLEAKRALVLVPSLGLLSQILNDWTSTARLPFQALCVCSDQTAGKRDEDPTVGSVSDLAFPVTNSAAEIARREIAQFLRGDGYRVIFSTYHSSPLIADAQQDSNVPHFDLIVADEAHRCAGKVDGVFATVLDGTKLRSTRRLFATATPRTYTSSLKRKAEEIGVEVADMNDEAVFGKRLHVLSFGDAIRLEYLSDYRVVIVGVDDEIVADWIRSRRIVAADAGIETDAQSLAAEIGLIKAMKDWDLQRIISFHSRVERAKQFAQELQVVFAWLGDKHKPLKAIWCEHVSGSKTMPTIMRRQKLQRLKGVADNEIGLLSNARCLSEGVDVPALDGVAFIDARNSKTDIIQAVGRAIRLSAKKEMGTIVIPVFIERAEDPEEAVASSNFKPIWDVVDALKSHDDVLSDQLDRLRIELGTGKRAKVGEQDLSKIVFDLPTTVNAKFAEAVRAHLVAETTEFWLFWYGLLQAFVKEHEHCKVYAKHVTADGYRLGSWVDKQRQRQDGMSAERKARLDALEFIWDRHEALWEEGFEHLEAYASERGDCQVSFSFISADGYALGAWVNTQRVQEGRMSAERKARLNALGFVWAALTNKWEEGYQHLQAYVSEHGDCGVQLRHKSADGYRLGTWVNKQRQKQNSMSAARKARLDALGFIWSPHEALWEEGFDHLQAFVKENGDCEVSDAHVTEDGYPLGQWVRVQRRQKDCISAERKTRLDALGFIWDVLAQQWEVGFQHLATLVRENRNCRVLATHVAADGYPLGQWVKVQRRRKDRMSAERRARLNALGFVWDTRASKRRAVAE